MTAKKAGLTTRMLESVVQLCREESGPLFLPIFVVAHSSAYAEELSRRLGREHEDLPLSFESSRTLRLFGRLVIFIGWESYRYRRDHRGLNEDSHVVFYDNW